jgi:hypothetical protein
MAVGKNLMTSVYTTTPSDTNSSDKLTILSAALADQRHLAEWDLLTAILAESHTLLVVAREERVEPGLFYSGDLRTIFCVALVTHDLGAVTVRQMVKTALIKFGEWDATAPHWYRGGLHSDATLDSIFSSFFKDEAAVRTAARRLWALHNRQMLAQDYLVRAERLLSSDESLADELAKVAEVAA